MTKKVVKHSALVEIETQSYNIIDTYFLISHNEEGLEVHLSYMYVYTPVMET